MNNIVCVASTVSVGCSFVDWSIHFLSGKNKFYSIKNSDWVPLTLDPITKTNAHGHNKNHPAGYNSAWEYIKKLKHVSDSELLSFYPHPLHADVVAKILGIEILNTETATKIQNYQKIEYATTINSFIESGIKVVYMNTNKHNILYTQVARSLDRLYFAAKPAKDFAELKDHAHQLFFADAIESWKKDDLTNIWDCREREALCVRPFDTDLIMEDIEINFTKSHLYVEAEAMWYSGKNTIKKIMKFLNIPIDETAWEQWTMVYYKWQQIQLDILEFVINFDHIINSIVNNWHYDIGELTFEQEVIIQHCLIYKHGLNLKTWQLEKFPPDAQELHKLLEPNIHPVPSIY